MTTASRFFLFGALLSCLLVRLANESCAAERAAGIRLYAADCGRIDFKDLGIFSDTGDYNGRSGSMADPCFVIRHPQGVLLWDVGLGDALVGHDVPPNSDGVSLHVESRFLDELSRIGLKPADVTYLGFSHFHLDHTGNANAFAHSTWIINKAELDWALQDPTPPIVDLKTFDGYRSAKTRIIDSDFDVFGDGTVRILVAPGHTPGHQVLFLKLRKAGPVILSGDLYHMRSDRAVDG